MKLYHAAPAEAVESILENGLEAHGEFCISATDREITEAVIYGFDNASDAEDFAIDQCYDGGFVVFSFEAEEVVIDPEYDGNAFAAKDASFVEIKIDSRH
jgi:hypothetical protein